MRQLDQVASTSGGSWELYKDDERNVVRDEVDSAGDPHERAMIKAELRSQMRNAQNGQLKPYRDLKNLQLRPELYEIRLNRDTVRLWRLYFAWLPERGPLRLALKFGGKSRTKAGRGEQDQHIIEA